MASTRTADRPAVKQARPMVFRLPLVEMAQVRMPMRAMAAAMVRIMRVSKSRDRAAGGRLTR